MVLVLFSLFSGINLAFAVMSLFVYSKDKTQNLYLYFSVFSFFSGLYFLFQSIGAAIGVDLGSLILFSAAAYYAIFPWFLFEFVGRKPPKKYLWPLSILFFIAFLVFMFIPQSDQVQYWQIIAHLGLIGLIICVIIVNVIYKQEKRPRSIQLVLISVLFIALAIEEILRYHLDIDLFFAFLTEIIQPLDVYPFLFTLAMGFRMSKDFNTRKKMELDAIHMALNEKKMQVLQLEKLRLKDEINFKKRDLTDFGIEISRKREFINKLLKQLNVIKNESHIKSPELDDIIKSTKAQLKIDQHLDYFHQNVEVVNHEFNGRLKELYPELTEGELHLSSLLRLKLNSKEIARLKNISPDSVKVLRYRLRKKFSLTKDINIVDFLQQF